MLSLDKEQRCTANNLIKSIVETEMIEMKKKIEILEDMEKQSNQKRNDDDLDSTYGNIADFVKSQYSILKSKINIMLMDECKS